MYKKSWGSLALMLVLTIIIVGCSQQAAGFKVGMITDAGTIDDKSFNQGTWEGVVKAAEELKLEYQYLKPGGTTEADYMKEIGNMYDAGIKFIVCPGFKFETAIFEAQDKYPDAKFVILDGNPHAGDFVPVVKENTVAIFFAEHESGFVAGVASALQLKDAEMGYIGGMEIPAVQRSSTGASSRALNMPMRTWVPI